MNVRQGKMWLDSEKSLASKSKRNKPALPAYNLTSAVNFPQIKREELTASNEDFYMRTSFFQRKTKYY